MLAAGLYNGTLVDFTYSMMHVHQGISTYHNSTMKDKRDYNYNKLIATHFARLFMTPYSIYKTDFGFAFNLTSSIWGPVAGLRQTITFTFWKLCG